MVEVVKVQVKALGQEWASTDCTVSSVTLPVFVVTFIQNQAINLVQFLNRYMVNSFIYAIEQEDKVS